MTTKTDSTSECDQCGGLGNCKTYPAVCDSIPECSVCEGCQEDMWIHDELIEIAKMLRVTDEDRAKMYRAILARSVEGTVDEYDFREEVIIDAIEKTTNFKEVRKSFTDTFYDSVFDASITHDVLECFVRQGCLFK